MFFPIKDYNPTKRAAVFTVIFILINVGVYFYQSSLSDKPFEYHIVESAMIPYEVTHLKNIPDPIGYDQFGRPVRRDISPIVSMFTSMFMHGSFMHLFGNMLFLWIFGNNIEDHLGIGKFIIFYLLAGIAAGIVHILFNFNSLTPVIGASGAVSGVMGAYLVLYPNARIKTLVFLFIFVSFIDIPAKIFLIIWFVYQFLYAGGSSGIAWLAHVGGFLAGMVLVKILQNKKPTHYEIIQ